MNESENPFDKIDYRPEEQMKRERALSGKSQTAGSVCGWCRGNGAVMYPQLQECHHCDGTGVTPNRVLSGKLSTYDRIKGANINKGADEG